MIDPIPSTTTANFPLELHTERLVLRCWQADDAPALQPLLEDNREHLYPWIPARVREPAELDALRERLTAFAAEFAVDREWRFAMYTADRRTLLGDVGLFPRSAVSRVPFTESDRVELGYWVRADATGQGYVTEAVRAAIAVAATFSRFSHVEIRCDERNERSSAVPRRLGFALAETVGDQGVGGEKNDVRMQVWVAKLRP